MNLSVGDFFSAAFCTMSSILWIVESLKAPDASTIIIPSAAMVPLLILLPLAALLGSDSPVIGDVSMYDSPPTTIPSIGICSPGSTCMMSPFLMLPGDIFVICSPVQSLAYVGFCANSELIEVRALCDAFS